MKTASATVAAALATATIMNAELCLVCGDRASGRHYGAISCEGCKGFFKRSIRKQLGYQCRGSMNCEVTKHHRNRCQFCRLQKCLASGMRSDSVQHERKPIVDKKEALNIVPTGSNGTASVSTVANISHKSNNSPVYRIKQEQQQKNSAYGRTAASAAAAALGFENKIAAAGVFPMGLNIAEFTQTLMLATQHNQQQPKQQNALCYSPPNTDTSTVFGNHSMKVEASNACSNNDAKKKSDNNKMNQKTHTLKTEEIDDLSINNRNHNNNGNDTDTESTVKTVDADDCVSSEQNEGTKTQSAVNLMQAKVEQSVIEKALQLLHPVQQQQQQQQCKRAKSSNSNNINIDNNGNDSNNIVENVDLEQLFEELDDNYSDDAESDLLDAIALDDLLLHQAQTYICYELSAPDEPLLTTIGAASFNLQAPALVSVYFNVHYVCETASRIIFLSVFWLRRITVFSQLQTNIQIKLLRNAWPGLLTIALAQVRNISMPTIMATLNKSLRQMAELEKLETQRIHKFSEHIARLQTYICEMLALGVDDVEYALLRLIIIFNPYTLLRRRERNMRRYVRQVQLNALNALRKHIMEAQSSNYKECHVENAENYNNNMHKTENDCKFKQKKFKKEREIESGATDLVEERYNTLVMNLLSLNELNAHMVEELFFANLVGQVHIYDMIPYILTLSTSNTGSAGI